MLRSLDNEILSAGSGGGAPWLREHLGSGYRACWQNALDDGDFDSAICNQGLSRWANYYVEGLRALLRPHGAMRLALYSRGARARAGVTAARAFAQSAGLDGGKARDIHRFRSMVMAMHDGRPTFAACCMAMSAGDALLLTWAMRKDMGFEKQSNTVCHKENDCR